MAASVDQAIAQFAPALPLGVALSGGADSTALLVACARRFPQQVRAVHVHHGLQAAADDFAAHCHRLCEALGVPLHIMQVDARHTPGQSPEDAARIARYACFMRFAQRLPGQEAIESIAIAHHADDQIETVLLALSRGAGLPGLAGMAGRWQRDGITYHRPLLAVAGAEVRRWLQAQGIGWIDDPTNADTAFTRNRIRAHLLPAFEATFPQFRATFARSAAHAAQASALLVEVAREDLHHLGVPPSIAGLQKLSVPRQANLLRHWLASCHQTTPTTAQLSELLSQIAACTTRGHRIAIKVGRGCVQRHGTTLDWYTPGVLV